MNKFRQHIPDFFDGFTRTEFDFKDLNELLNHEFIKKAKNQPNFYKFSLADDCFMLELREGKEWWVLGHISHPEDVDLPKWNPKE